ncbi:hypothetical protein J4W10_15635, partial [Escherichia coli]
IIPIRQSYPIGDTCRLPTGHGLPHRNRPVNNSAIIRTPVFPSSSRKSSLLYRARVRKHRFVTTTRHTGTAQPP